MNGLDFEDTLEPLGVGTGVLLVLVGLGTLAGQPWATLDGIGPLALQLVGVFALLVVGSGLAWLSYGS